MPASDWSGLVSLGFRHMDSETPLCTASGNAQGCSWTIARGQQQTARHQISCSLSMGTHSQFFTLTGRANLYANIATRQTEHIQNRSRSLPNNARIDKSLLHMPSQFESQRSLDQGEAPGPSPRKACSTLIFAAGCSSKNLSASVAFPPHALSRAKKAKWPPTTGLAMKWKPG